MLPVHTKDESLPHKREQFLTVIGRLVLQPVSFHIETLFPAQVCVQRQTILAAAILLQRLKALKFVFRENIPPLGT
jgi:hypothetical protein